MISRAANLSRICPRCRFNIALRSIYTTPAAASAFSTQSYRFALADRSNVRDRISGTDAAECQEELDLELEARRKANVLREKIGYDALGQPFDAIVFKDAEEMRIKKRPGGADRQPRPIPDLEEETIPVRAEDLIEMAEAPLYASLEKAALALDELRPQGRRKLLMPGRFEQLLEVISEGFTLPQLEAYLANDQPSESSTTSYPWLVKEAQYTRVGGSKRPTFPLRRKRDSTTPKLRLAARIILDKWTCSLWRLEQGTMEIWLRPDIYERIMLHSDTTLPLLNAKLKHKQQAPSLTFAASQHRITVKGTRDAAHAILRRIDQIFQSLRTRTISLKYMSKSNFRKPVLQDIESVTGTVLRYSHEDATLSIMWLNDWASGRSRNRTSMEAAVNANDTEANAAEADDAKAHDTEVIDAQADDIQADNVQVNAAQENDAEGNDAEVEYVEVEDAEHTDVKFRDEPKEDPSDHAIRLLAEPQDKGHQYSLQVVLPEKQRKGGNLMITKWDREANFQRRWERFNPWSRVLVPVSATNSNEDCSRPSLNDTVSFPPWPRYARTDQFKCGTTATFGQILHSTSLSAAAILRSKGDRILSPMVPHPAALTRLSEGSNLSALQSTAIVVRFALDPTKVDVDVDALPHWELRLPVNLDSDLSSVAVTSDILLEGLASQGGIDALFPDASVDVRIARDVTLSLDANASTVQNFLAASELNLLEGRLSTPRHIRVSVPTRQGKQPYTDAAVEASYNVTGLEIHQMVETRYHGFTLRYNSIEAGESGGQRQELSLVYPRQPGSNSRAKVADTREQDQRFLQAVDEIATGKAFSWHDGHKLARMPLQDPALDVDEGDALDPKETLQLELAPFEVPETVPGIEEPRPNDQFRARLRMQPVEEARHPAYDAPADTEAPKDDGDLGITLRDIISQEEIDLWNPSKSADPAPAKEKE